MTVQDIFCNLVQIDSPSGEEKSMAEYIATFLRTRCNLHASVDEHTNVFVQTAGTGMAIFHNAHMDTVEPGRGIQPVDDGEYWMSDGDTILGADNKAACAAILASIEYICAHPNETWRPLDVLFTTSEETGNYGAIGFDRRRLRAKQGFIFDAALPIGTIITQSPYYARFDITVHGRSAHAGHREQAVSGVPRTVEVISQIELLRTNETLINIGMIQGGTARNTVIGDMSLKGEVRTFDESLLKHAHEDIVRICSMQTNTEIEFVVENPGYSHAEREIAHIEKFIRQNHLVPHAQSDYGCADANIFNTDLHQLEVFVLGDGTEHPHTVRERIRKKDLDMMQRLILASATESSF